MNSNNQMIQKGKISSVEGKADRNGDKTTARVLPSTADSMVTRPLTIPWYLRGEMGNLTPGTEVAYAMFEDGTGIILSRMDGEWGGIVPGDITVKKGALTMQDKGISVPSADVTATGISLICHPVSIHRLGTFSHLQSKNTAPMVNTMQKSIEKLIVVSTCLYFVKLIFWKSAAEPLHLDLLWAHYIHTL